MKLGLGQERKGLKRPIRSGLQPCGVSQNPTIASRGETGVQCSLGGWARLSQAVPPLCAQLKGQGSLAASRPLLSVLRAIECWQVHRITQHLGHMGGRECDMGSAGSPDDIQEGWMGSPPVPGLSFPGGSLFIPLID